MLERECGRNLELMWLMRKLRPDFKTIADFRKENRQSFKGVFRQFVLLCKKLGLFGGELVAVDRSKFKAVNSGQRNFSAKKLNVIWMRWSVLISKKTRRRRLPQQNSRKKSSN